MSTAATTGGRAKGGRSEYGVALLLLGLGIWAIVDSLGLSDTGAKGHISAKTLPIAVGVLLIGTAVMLVADIARGGRGEAEGGEDVDLSHGTDWRTMGILLAAFAVNAALIDSLGWPITGAILFFGTAFALGSRQYVRLALISVVLSVGSWYLFFFGLGLKLPTGVLTGII